MLAIDHLVVAAASLVQGVDWCEATLGVTPGPGGTHVQFGTHNRLLKIATPAFPLAYLLSSEDRERVDARYRDFLRNGSVFDESMALRDTQGVLREVRVVCVVRPGTTEDAAPVIVTIASTSGIATPAKVPTTGSDDADPAPRRVVTSSGRAIPSSAHTSASSPSDPAPNRITGVTRQA